MNQEEKYVACFNCDAIGKVQFFTGLSDSMVTVWYCDNCWEEMGIDKRSIDDLFPEVEVVDGDIPF